MKTKQNLMMLVGMLLLLISTKGIAQKNISTCQIKANVACQTCKTKIEENIAFQKGVKEVDANISTNIVYIKYKSNKNTAENFVKIINDLGYGGELISDSNADDASTESKSCCSDKKEHQCTSKGEEHKCASKEEEHKDCCKEKDKNTEHCKSKETSKGCCKKN
jgi:periplasmic mercuric ion binding protein